MPSSPSMSLYFLDIYAYMRFRQIHNAAQHPIALDERQADAVEARIVLDLKVGAAFTRHQTMSLQSRIQELAVDKSVLSYGTHISDDSLYNLLIFPRTLPIPNTGLCRQTLQFSHVISPRKLLVHLPGTVETERLTGRDGRDEVQLETRPLIRSSSCHESVL